MVRTSMDVLGTLRKRIEESEPDLLRTIVHSVTEMLMSAEVDQMCGAEYRERSEERENYRNGYRTRDWDTRVGTIPLEIPRLRQGSYFPDWLLGKGKRAERSLVTVVAEAYVLGVSTRRMEKLVETLGVRSLSKSQVSEMAREMDQMVSDFRNRPLTGGYAYVWLDALAVRCREGGSVVNVAVMTATGVGSDGHRQILGMDVYTAEDEASWTSFLRDLRERGLSGVQLVISDAHKGLKAAIAAEMMGAAWQRCRTHFATNLLCQVPRSAQPEVSGALRSIFEQSTPDEVIAQHKRVVKQLARFPKASKMLEEAGPDILAFAMFPKEHWKKIRSNNPQERLNKEIRRRTNVVGIFPNREAIIRLIGAVLAEQHDEWTAAICYMAMESIELANSKNERIEALLKSDVTPLPEAAA